MHHKSAERAWNSRLMEVVRAHGTPVFVFQYGAVAERLRELSNALVGLPVRHWYSLKTCPLPILLDRWRRDGHGVEVVSDFELQAALRVGFLPKQILVNGVAKHSWLPRHCIDGLHVNLDSMAEIRALGGLARERSWSIGLRFHPESQRDPDNERFPDQFGIHRSNLGPAVDLLRTLNLEASCMHMHLRSNVSVTAMSAALAELSEVIDTLGIRPSVLDVGGGLAAPGVELPFERGALVTPATLFTVIKNAIDRMPSVKELWLENGRYLLAPSGVLLIRVNDIKEHDGLRFMICDGGRTNHALVSDWESHVVSTIPARDGIEVPTVLCGPTCMAFDHLLRGSLPRAIEIGDVIVWHDAGGYHLPWETRFSHGLAPVVFLDPAGGQHLARPRETFNNWWDQWSITRT